MNPVRRATPDSEALGSSEDERPWPSSMSFGKFPMKESGVPGMPGGIWGTQKRGSFKISDVAQRNAARDAARLGAAAAANANAPIAALKGPSTPSPSASEGASALPFAIPLQPTPKTGRSLSHSQGQREAPLSAGALHGASAGPAGTAALPLGLLAEEDVDTDTESDMGSRLTHTTSHPPIGSLMRTSTLPAAYDTMSGASSSRDRHAAPHSPSHRDLMRTQTFESAFANLSIDHPHRRASQWQSSLGWDDVPNVNESRRHSLADIPTRRGSLAGGEPSLLSRTYTHDVFETESPTSLGPTHHPNSYNSDRSEVKPRELTFTGSITSTCAQIPAMYRTQRLPLPNGLANDERRELDYLREQQLSQQRYGGWGSNNGGKPKKQLFIVSFKCSRVDVFYLLDNTGLRIQEGDLVIVEADRGQDLGTVQHANVTQDEARMYKKAYSEEQYKWLMMYSRNKDGAHNPNALMRGEAQLFPDAPSTMQGSLPRENYNNLKPKAIKRLASEHEVRMLAEKEGNEAKAKRTCQHKVSDLNLRMEILDAEWQWDFQKLIFYYYADQYINFNHLITELYRVYKTRIWLSAINPASFSQHAVGQPPSGIGPGAVPPYSQYGRLNNGYTMSYGEDRDPYGAQMPYNIPFNTYDPNYPSIPGVANSFAPAYASNNGYDYYATQGASTQSNARMDRPMGYAPAGAFAQPGLSRGSNSAIPTQDARFSGNGRGMGGFNRHATLENDLQSRRFRELNFSDDAESEPQFAASPATSRPWEQPLGLGDSAARTRRESNMPDAITERRASLINDRSGGVPVDPTRLYGVPVGHDYEAYGMPTNDGNDEEMPEDSEVEWDMRDGPAGWGRVNQPGQNSFVAPGEEAATFAASRK